MLHRALDRLRLARRRQRDAVGRFAHRPDMLEQFEAARGERETASDPLEQDDAELFLERIDLPAKRRLRHAEGARRGRERAFFGGDQKGARPVPVEFHRAPIHA